MRKLSFVKYLPYGQEFLLTFIHSFITTCNSGLLFWVRVRLSVSQRSYTFLELGLLGLAFRISVSFEFCCYTGIYQVPVYKIWRLKTVTLAIVSNHRGSLKPLSVIKTFKCPRSEMICFQWWPDILGCASCLSRHSWH